MSKHQRELKAFLDEALGLGARRMGERSDRPWPTEIRVPTLGESVDRGDGRQMVQAGRRRGLRRRAFGRARDRQGDGRSAGSRLGRACRRSWSRPGETVAVGALLGAITEGDGKAKPAKAKPARRRPPSLAAAEAAGNRRASRACARRSRASAEPKTLEREPKRREEVQRRAKCRRHPPRASCSPRAGLRRTT